MRKETVIIEKGKDGSFSAYPSSMKTTIIGEGDTVKEAKEDFLNSYEEMLEYYREEGRGVPEELMDVEFEYLKIIAIIEKGADGLYSVRTEQRIGNFCPGGFGENVDEAKKDFLDSISEAMEMLPGSESMTIDEMEVEFQYDL